MNIQNVVPLEDIIKSLQTIALVQRDAISLIINKLEMIDVHTDELYDIKKYISIVICELKDLL